MKNLLLSMTILAIFLSVNNIAFAQDYDSTKYLQDLKEVEKSRQQYIQIHHANQKYLQEQRRIQEEREKAQREYERQQQLEELKRNPILMEEDGRHKKYFDGQNIIFTYDEMTDEEYEEFQRQNRW